jgi:hypothetical protein
MENGGCAFPHEHHRGCTHCEHGMALRDYFACHILDGIIKPGDSPSLIKAQEAYQWSAYMIEARKQDYPTGA